MSSLSTHVLDTVAGCPAAGVALRLYASGQCGGGQELFRGRTDADGRCPALRTVALGKGVYRLEFDVGAYFMARGTRMADPPFLSTVPVLFGLGEDVHVHVPLLAAPYGYSTYRGS
jgi:5-hydroxyisourate hydrolase